MQTQTTFAIQKEELRKYHTTSSFLSCLFGGLSFYGGGVVITIPIWLWYRNRLRKGIDNLSYELKDDRLIIGKFGWESGVVNIPLAEIVSVELGGQNYLQKNYGLRDVRVTTDERRKHNLEGLEEPERALEQILQAIKFAKA